MIYTLIAFSGSFLGYFIANFTKDELKSGLIYFKILELAILLILSIGFLYFSFSLVLFFFGVLFGVFFRKEYFYFGIGIFSNFNANVNFLASGLVFIYGLPHGTMAFYRKRFFSLFYNLIWFFLPVIIYYLGYDMLSFAGGGLASLFVFKIRTYFGQSLHL